MREHIETSLDQLDHPPTEEDVALVLRQLGPAEAVAASWADGEPGAWTPASGEQRSFRNSALAIICVVLALFSVGALAVPVAGVVFQVVALVVTWLLARRATTLRLVHLAAAVVTGGALVGSIVLMLFFYSASSGPTDGSEPTSVPVSSLD
ncbi:hypothetical protein [uncultured Modestobacter sp.]|uniref:hypothetical protein n=1 Tax=uncultured Modestobacter sp. TaxID=380048 RepID=UPI0026383013|nr:hypothetical protein [uncultured Modestobacter sp.]